MNGIRVGKTYSISICKRSARGDAIPLAPDVYNIKGKFIIPLGNQLHIFRLLIEIIKNHQKSSKISEITRKSSKILNPQAGFIFVKSFIFA